jgi:trigger factor
MEKLEKSQVKLNFTVDMDTFNKAVDTAYQRSKGKFSIAGFRKGHVPKKVIEGIYGKEVFYEDAMDIVIPDAYGEALREEEALEVVAQPELTSFDFSKDGTSVTFSLVVTVKPEVKLGAYKNLEIEKKVEKVNAKKVEDTLKEEQEKRARMLSVDAPAKKGDTVTIDFVGTVDGEVFDGGSAEGHKLELGSNSFIPGFEEQLIGAVVGDKKAVEVTFPEDYFAETLKGKKAVFACTVHAVETKELPKLDDEFAKDASEFDTLAEYKDDLKKKLTEEAEKNAEREYEDALVAKIVENAEVEIPEAMVEAEADEMVKEFEYRLMYQGMKMDDYLGYLNMTREQLSEQYRPQAMNTVKTRLVL